MGIFKRYFTSIHRYMSAHHLSLPSYFPQTLSCRKHGKYEIGFPKKDKPGRILNFDVCSGKFLPHKKSIGTVITVVMKPSYVVMVTMVMKVTK